MFCLIESYGIQHRIHAISPPFRDSPWAQQPSSSRMLHGAPPALHFPAALQQPPAAPSTTSASPRCSLSEQRDHNPAQQTEKSSAETLTFSLPSPHHTSSQDPTLAPFFFQQVPVCQSFLKGWLQSPAAQQHQGTCGVFWRCERSPKPVAGAQRGQATLLPGLC